MKFKIFLILRTISVKLFILVKMTLRASFGQGRPIRITLLASTMMLYESMIPFETKIKHSSQKACSVVCMTCLLDSISSALPTEARERKFFTWKWSIFRWNMIIFACQSFQKWFRGAFQKSLFFSFFSQNFQKLCANLKHWARTRKRIEKHGAWVKLGLEHSILT